MSYQSKFIERFDIDPSDTILQDMLCPPSPRNSSVYSSPELNGSDNSFKGTKPIAIPSSKKRSKHMSVTPPSSPPRTDAFSSKFKQFFNTLSKKKHESRSMAISSA